MKKLPLLVTCLFFIMQVYAQRVVTGKVTDENGIPVANATVTVKETGAGATTDASGQFSLRLENEAKTLVISFVGKATQEVPLTESGTYSIRLSPAGKSLEEVVVVAYGTTTKKTFTGSVSELKAADINKQQVSNLSRAFDGMLPGVRVSANSGQPGSGQNIILRGLGSISLDNTPLWVVDGVPYNGDINAINPADVESVSVQKGSSATALYGSRASNGVIIVTTKKGKGKARFDIQARWGVNTRGVPEYDVIRDPGQFLEVYWQYVKHEAMFRATNPLSEAAAGAFASNAMFGAGNGRLDRYNPYSVPAGQTVIDPVTGKLNPNATLKYQDNWEDALFNNRLRQEYVATMSGSADKTSYLFSLGYLDDGGIVIKTGFERITARLNLEQKVNNWLKLGLNTNYAKTNQDNTLDAALNNTSYQNLFYWTRNIAPVYPIYTRDANGAYVLDPKGNPYYDFGDIGGNPHSMGVRRYSATENPRATLDLDDIYRKADNINTRSFIAINPVKDLTITLNYSYDYRGSRQVRNQNPLYGNAGIIAGQVGVQGRGTLTQNKLTTQLINQLVNYKTTIKDNHNLDLLVGHESYELVSENSFSTKEIFMLPGLTELSSAAKVVDAQSGRVNHNIESWFARAQYDFDGKYLLSASIRRDGSSRFHPDNRWGNFWSVGAGYVLSEEPFMKNIRFIDQLKIKADYGLVGNDAILYPAGTQNPNAFNYYPYATQYVIVTSGSANIKPDYIGNKDITWEKNRNLDIGMEFSLFRRFQGSIEYFNRDVQDMLFNVPVAPSTGVQTRAQNFGTINLKGIEFDLNVQVINKKDFKWSVGLNGTHYKTVVKELPDEFVAVGTLPPGRIGTPAANFRLAVGKDPYEYFLWQFAGVDAADGKALYYRDEIGTNGQPTGKKITTNVFSNATRYYTGKTAVPDITGGFNTTLRYMNFDLSAIASYGLGGWTFDATYQNLMQSGSTDITTWHKDILGAWSTSNTGSNIPRISENYQDANQTSDRFLIRSDYLALRNITLGYTFPNNILTRYGFSAVRVYVVADNVFLSTKRQGLDTRQSFIGNTFNGYAPIRTVSAGINFSF